MFIPNPNFFHPGKNLFPSSRKYDPSCSSRIRILIFYLSRIPDPGVKNPPDPGSGSATLVGSKRVRSRGLSPRWAVHFASYRALSFTRCPTCYYNFRKNFCDLTCHPRQSRFLRTDKRVEGPGSGEFAGLVYLTSLPKLILSLNV
jgi:hypothetical protein